MKRAFDLVGAACGLVLTAPLLLLLVLLIRRESSGAGIFSQTRVGRSGAPFVCHKLRTMRSDTETMPTHLAQAAQVTPMGRMLRRTKLDELPQLWNVLKGEMSFVGPRPCLPMQTALIAERQSRGVFGLRPGITGLAQIKGIDMSDPVRLAETDAEYARRGTFVFDLQILAKTVLRGAGRGDLIRD